MGGALIFTVKDDEVPFNKAPDDHCNEALSSLCALSLISLLIKERPTTLNVKVYVAPGLRVPGEMTN